MRRARQFTILGILIGSAIALVAWSQEWFSFSVSEGVVPTRLAVSGIQANGSVSAISFGLVAAAIVMLIASSLWRYLVTVIALALGASGLVLTGNAASDPLVASMGTLSLATGVANADSVGLLVVSSTVSVWPAVTIAGFSIALAAATFGLATIWTWPRASRRFNRPETSEYSARAAATNYNDGEAWDVLSHGTDPTQSH